MAHRLHSVSTIQDPSGSVLTAGTLARCGPMLAADALWSHDLSAPLSYCAMVLSDEGFKPSATAISLFLVGLSLP